MFFFNSSDIDDLGPFLTIKDVLDLDYFWAEDVPGGELDYDTSIVPGELARSIGLTMCGKDGGTVRINGVTFVRQNDALQALSQPEQIK